MSRRLHCARFIQIRGGSRPAHFIYEGRPDFLCQLSQPRMVGSSSVTHSGSASKLCCCKICREGQHSTSASMIDLFSAVVHSCKRRRQRSTVVLSTPQISALLRMLFCCATVRRNRNHLSLLRRRARLVPVSGLKVRLHALQQKRNKPHTTPQKGIFLQAQ